MPTKQEEKKILSKGLSKIALSKSVKISQAQQYTLLAVLGAGIFLGLAVAIVIHFVNKISFNAEVISEEDASIVAFSEAIEKIGICRKPKSGNTYSDKELEDCDPNAIDVTSIPGTLRSNVLQVLAANKALSSVPKEDASSCINPTTKQNFTYAELNKIYDSATTTDERVAATKLIQNCSALRVIPDALPAYRNEEALLSSLNKIFLISNWEPDVISPTGEYDVAVFDPTLNTISVRMLVDTDFATTMTFLKNLERSIREYDIEYAGIEWSGDNSINLLIRANAFYVTPSELIKTTITVEGDDATQGENQ